MRKIKIILCTPVAFILGVIAVIILVIKLGFNETLIEHRKDNEEITDYYRRFVPIIIPMSLLFWFLIFALSFNLFN